MPYAFYAINKRLRVLYAAHFSGFHAINKRLQMLYAAATFLGFLWVSHSAELRKPVGEGGGGREHYFHIIPLGHLFQIVQYVKCVKPAQCTGFTHLWLGTHFLQRALCDTKRGGAQDIQCSAAFSDAHLVWA